jgi:cyanophycinase
MSTQAFALLGSGEFDPWTATVDEWLTTRGGAAGTRVLVIPTACAAEGDEVFDMWASKGLGHYASLGIPAQVLPLKTREDAARPELAAALDGAAVAYFSGGNPAYLAGVLRDTPFWGALREAMTRGLAYAGCSAGVACLGDRAPDSARRSFDEDLWEPGLGVFPDCFFGPHWDALDGYAPGLRDFIVASVPDGATLVAIDENTAMMGDGEHWRMAGVGSVHVLSHGGWTEHAPGSAFDLRLGH